MDRAAIGDIVFRDLDERRWLNSVVHPRVRREIVKRVLGYWLKGEWCVVVDVPLLIEAGLWKWVGEVVVVYVWVERFNFKADKAQAPIKLCILKLGFRNEKLQLSRLLNRPSDPPLSQTQAQARISSQMPLSSKITYSTSIIDNSGTLSDLTSQVDRQVARWRAQQGGGSGWWWRVCWLLPPVGLVAGGLCLAGRWWRGRKGRRRGRGEVERKRSGVEGERIELSDLGGRRRAAISSTAGDG